MCAREGSSAETRRGATLGPGRALVGRPSATTPCSGNASEESLTSPYCVQASARKVTGSMMSGGSTAQPVRHPLGLSSVAGRGSRWNSRKGIARTPDLGGLLRAKFAAVPDDSRRAPAASAARRSASLRPDGESGTQRIDAELTASSP